MFHVKQISKNTQNVSRETVVELCLMFHVKQLGEELRDGDVSRETFAPQFVKHGVFHVKRCFLIF